MHARKNPAEVAAEALERLIAYGGNHLRPNAAYSLNVVQFYMLDVLFALYLMLLIVIVIVGYCILRCIKCAVRNVPGPKSKRKLE